MRLNRKHWLLLIPLLVLCLGQTACQADQQENPESGLTPTRNQPTPTSQITATLRPSPWTLPESTPAIITPSAVPDDLPPTSLPCWEKGGYSDRFTLVSNQLEDPLEYRVYLPPCYYHQTDRSYPVLYLLHGLYSNDIQWVRIGVEETANRMMASGEIPPFIIIMPNDMDWEIPPTNKFGEVLVKELVLRVDNQFRTIPTREYRAIGGLSRGGNWALHIGLQYWGIFGALGAHSAPVFITDGMQIAGWLDDIPPESMPRIFLDIGHRDANGAYLHVVEEMLSERGIPHEWYLNIGRHNEEYWSANLDEYLRWYSEPWKN